MKYKSIFEKVAGDPVLNPIHSGSLTSVHFELILTISGLKKNRHMLASEEQLCFLANLIYTYILAKLLCKGNRDKQLYIWRRYYAMFATPKMMIPHDILEKAINAQYTAWFHGEIFQVRNKLRVLGISDETTTRLIDKVYDRLNKKEESRWV